jgi:ribonuclease HIII
MDIEELVDRALDKLESAGILASRRRSLANGVRVEFQGPDSSCGINFYYSKKRGFSVVHAGGDPSLAASIRDKLISGSFPDSGEGPCQVEAGESGRTLIGADEAGKGDYMGPLTTAALYSGPGDTVKLREMGVRDSKKIPNIELRKLALRIRSQFNHRFSVVVIKPLEYNRMMEQMSKSGRNSLDLLAECHAEAIGVLMDSLPVPETVLIDKCCSESRISHLLPHADYHLQLRERAESDPVVAAASILARDAYLQGLDDISEEFGIKAVSGAGRNVDEIVRRFVRRYGSDVLYRVAKVHFKNTGKVISLFS